MFKKKNLLSILLASLFPITAWGSDIVFDNAWVREAPPISKVQAGYVNITNNKQVSLTLTSASSPAFKKIEFHETITDNGLSKMQHLTSVSLASNNSVSFKPEGMHMMLFNPSKPLRAGETINITFSFSDNTTITTRFIIKKTTGSHSNHSTHH